MRLTPRGRAVAVLLGLVAAFILGVVTADLGTECYRVVTGR